ncbi:MAG: hypothetical protein ACRCXA_03090, partial [Peptostreptococcaceae bacterium]
MSKILTMEEYQKQTKVKLIKGRNQKVFDDENIVIEKLEDFFYIADINNINHILCDYIYNDNGDPFLLIFSFILDGFVYEIGVKEDYLEVDESEDCIIGDKEIIENELGILLKELSQDEDFMLNGVNSKYRYKVAKNMIEDDKCKYTLLGDEVKV